MKLLYSIITILLFALPIQAEDGADAAQSLAKKYCKNPSLKKTGVKPSELRSSSNEDPAYYIFSDDATDEFCIVSADGEKVLGYGGNYSDELPPQLQEALDMYATYGFSSSDQSSELRSATVREDIPYFMDVVFSTRSPYNKFIPEREGSGPPVGCVPVALAQICKYYNYPPKLLDDIPAYSHYSAVYKDSIFKIEGQKAEGRSYNWDLILNHYEKDTTEELNNEVAKLMWDCARSVETRFEQSGSSALTDMFVYSAIHFFGYNSDSIKSIERKYYYREEWLDIIHDELSKKRPIYMSASSYSHGGHAFVCDGYVNGYLHINWGWNGSSNGYFDVDIFDYNHGNHKEQTTPDNGYSFVQRIIVGITPGVGKTVFSRPQNSTAVIREAQINTSVDTKFRSIGNELNGNEFKMYVTLDSHINDANEDHTFALGYTNEEGKIAMFTNGMSGSFTSTGLHLEADKTLGNASLGKDLHLFVLESDNYDEEILVQDSIYNDWAVSALFDTITIHIPDTIANDNDIITPTDIHFVGDYADSSIVLNITMQADRPEGSMRYYALALVDGGDTLMSESQEDVSAFSDEITLFKTTFKDLYMNGDINSGLDREMTLLVMQTDRYSKDGKLDLKEWEVCNNFKPVSFKLSDCTIFARQLVVDTIVHTSKGVTERFEITFSNPSPFEFYNSAFFLVDNEPTALMLDIPADSSIIRIIERETPKLTRYINGFFEIYSNAETVAEMAYFKDTFSHVFYNLDGGDETKITMTMLNATSETYANSFFLLKDADTIASKEISIRSESVAEVNYNLPVIVSDTNFLKLSYIPYSIYDKDNNLLGKGSPLHYYGKISQDFDGEDKMITVELWPIVDSIMPPVRIGVTNSIEKTKSYQRLVYTPDTTERNISLEFKLSDYCTLDQPKYIGLCKEDGTFYAYMELDWENTNASTDLPSNGLNIIAADGGIWISSDVEIPSLPIYNIEGKLIKRVNISPESSLFVPLKKGIYVVGGKKVAVIFSF